VWHGTLADADANDGGDDDILVNIGVELKVRPQGVPAVSFLRARGASG
jgi:hypothetical protein